MLIRMILKNFPELVHKTAKKFDVQEVSADRAYSSKYNLKLIDKLGAVPFIPFKTNIKMKARGSMFWAKMYYFFLSQREEFLKHYHKRSNSETVFHMIKAKFGNAIRSKNKTAQINEILLKILCHNICVVIQEIHELGIDADFQ